jgi:hypothetical protein
MWQIVRLSTLMAVDLSIADGEFFERWKWGGAHPAFPSLGCAVGHGLT